MNKFVLRQSLLLLLTATIWGVAFVAQSVSMDYVGPFTFNAVRCLIGGVVLLPCIAILNKFNRKNGVECMEDETGKEVKSSPQSQKTLVIGGIAVAFYCAWQATCSSLESCIQALEKPDLSQPCIS